MPCGAPAQKKRLYKHIRVNIKSRLLIWYLTQHSKFLHCATASSYNPTVWADHPVWRLWLLFLMLHCFINEQHKPYRQWLHWLMIKALDLWLRTDVSSTYHTVSEIYFHKKSIYLFNDFIYASTLYCVLRSMFFTWGKWTIYLVERDFRWN